LRKLTLTSAVIVGALILTNCNDKVSTQKVAITAETSTTTTTPPPTTTTTTTTTVAPTTTTTTTLVPLGSKCEELAPLAVAAGWPQDLLVDVLDEAWNESRCENVIPGHPKWNGSDHGPMQINFVWKDEVENMFGSWAMIDDPLTNFKWAWEMYKWYDGHGYCGFKPWTRKCK